MDNTALSTEECIVCDRLQLFEAMAEIIDEKIWKGFGQNDNKAPMIYLGSNGTYLAFADTIPFDVYGRKIKCEPNNHIWFIDSLFYGNAFKMENRMDYKNMSSPFYYRPMMICSSVEKMCETVPDFNSTEDWLLLVIHEYFHSYQFTNGEMLNYLADSINLRADSLEKLYLSEGWFKDSLQKENDFLLAAIDAKDEQEVLKYTDAFLRVRKNRHAKYFALNNSSIERDEDFWESIEGTARYCEYYTAKHFSVADSTKHIGCDTLFEQYSKYTQYTDFKDNPLLSSRTALMASYFYVTGFNLCRLLDKLDITYHNRVFDSEYVGLKNLVPHYSKEVNKSLND